MKITSETEFIQLLSHHRQAPGEYPAEKRDGLLAAVYDFVLKNYMAGLKAILRSYGKSNILPYDFSARDGFNEFLHDVLSEKFIMGTALEKFDPSKQEFKTYLLSICRNQLHNVIKKNKFLVAWPEELSAGSDTLIADEAPGQPGGQESIAALYPLLFAGDLSDRKILYCSQCLLVYASDLTKNMRSQETNNLLNWRFDAEGKINLCEKDKKHKSG